MNAHDKADAVEAASAALAAGMRKLQATKDITRRRQIASDYVGALIGKLDAAMMQAAAERKPHERGVLNIARDKAVGDAIGVLMQACGMELES